MTRFDPKARSLIGRIGAHERWGRKADRVAATAPMRAGRDQKFRDEVCASVASQGITLPDDEIERRANHLRRAHMLRLALKSAQVRAPARHRVTDRRSKSLREKSPSLITEGFPYNQHR